MYVPSFRNSVLDLFSVFDGANPNIVSGDRNVSNVPAQALFLMNSPWVHSQARHAAERLLAAPDLADDAARLDHAYRAALGRAPRNTERDLTLPHLRSFGDDRLAAWASVFHALFACVDFRYVN